MSESHDCTGLFAAPLPGLVGEVANFIYTHAPYPVAEIATAGALGLIAGIVGRSYNVSGTGLNQYVLLLAPTGTGKAAMSNGIDKIIEAVSQSVPAAKDFIGPAEIASPQALVKFMSNGPRSFLSIVGEFGIQLKIMSHPKAAPTQKGLERLYLDLYNKSGEGDVLRPTIYSEREKNTAAILSPAFSILGESTPEKFYEALDESMISSGLLPRFTTIEYRGEVPYKNDDRAMQPSFEFTDRLAALAAHSLMLNQSGKPIAVELSGGAAAMFEDFEWYCRDKLEGQAEIVRHLWSRSHMKALKLAAIIAVGCNYIMPTITADSALWAIQLEKANVRNLLSRFESGEVGETSSEDIRVSRVIDAISSYCLKPWPELKSYDVRGDLHEKRIITYTYLHRRLSNTKPFKKQNHQEPTKLIKEALRTLVERGDIVEMSKAILAKDYEFNGVAYMLANTKLITK